MCNEIIMCKETEKLIKILQGSQNPTDMALIILANKMDDINEKIDKSLKGLDTKWEERFDELSLKMDVQIKEVKDETKFARVINTHKKIILAVLAVLFILATCGVSSLFEWAKTKLGM